MSLIRVLHTADNHFANTPDLLKDTVKCTDYLVSQAKEMQPDIIVISGDIFDGAVVLGSPASQSALDFVVHLGDIAPTLVLEGTPTHDIPESISVFGKLRTRHDVYPATTTTQVGLGPLGRFQPLTESNLGDFSVVIGCLPSVTKQGLLATQNMSIADSNMEIADLVRDVFRTFGVINAHARMLGIPTLIAAHGTLRGATLSTGQKTIGRDVEFGLADLGLAGADAALLGHIHKAQAWDQPARAYYPGSITRGDHGETEAKGFFFHEVSSGKVVSRFVETPARVMRTIHPEEGTLPTAELLHEINQGDVVRIVYRIRQEDAARVNDAELVRVAREKGASEVKIDKQIIPLMRTRAAGISRLDSYEEKLCAWGAAVNKEVSHLAGKLEMLLAMPTEEIIAGYRKKEEEEDEAALFEAQGF
jgi:exonuclease SbcD